MKENSGRARREQLTRKLCLVFLAFFTVMGALYALEHGFLWGLEEDDNVFVGGGKGGRGRAKKNLFNKLRRHQQRGQNYAALLSTRPDDHQDGGLQKTPTANDDKKLSWDYNRILAADYHLIDIQVTSDRDLRNAPVNSYDGVYGVFCQLDFSRHKEDPSAGTYVHGTQQ